MLAQRFIAICDRKGCKAKTKATLTLKTAQAVAGIQHPIVLQPVNIIFAEEGWLFAWNTTIKTTEIHCPEHGVRSNGKASKRRRD